MDWYIYRQMRVESLALALRIYLAYIFDYFWARLVYKLRDCCCYCFKLLRCLRVFYSCIVLLLPLNFFRSYMILCLFIFSWSCIAFMFLILSLHSVIYCFLFNEYCDISLVFDILTYSTALIWTNKFTSLIFVIASLYNLNFLAKSIFNIWFSWYIFCWDLKYCCFNLFIKCSQFNLIVLTVIVLANRHEKC